MSSNEYNFGGKNEGKMLEQLYRIKAGKTSACASRIKSLTRSLTKIHEEYAGKLYSGFTIAAKTSSSIPTKYQTIRIPISEKRGFNSQTHRFQYDLNQNENPGPGFYDITHGAPESKSVSLSKKGTGGFPSKTSRIPPKKTASTPAANAYDIPAFLSTRKDFSKGNSSMFQQPITVKVQNKHETPAPNQYNASMASTLGSSMVSARSAFLSKSRREVRGIQTGPSPCHYKINDSLVRMSATASVSCFKSKTLRGESPVPSKVGPGSYDPYGPKEPVKKLIYPRKHYLCFSAPAVPVPKIPAVPGPGQYELVDYEGPRKNYISSAAFVSNTSRWAENIPRKNLPGPGTYEPVKIGKQSFICNNHKKWIPA
ncbi:O(6)-methylguanine-induced apoptosis 2 isoform X2 [Rhinatrema bivittatum]|uniref:O(6)-methylguanine-induced apoptosis 2 isoform X2 n=1 Tax=Rhinatrema bivittatum TaxID=194408 RepID=UPI001125B37A|nr:O(6)-methylguanine-induced apoptosis 2 isoform X2 [Rhinatrema bivittatum]